MTTQYARIENGKVTEYPVTTSMIQKRGHPITWYSPCYYDPLPEIQPHQYYQQVPVISGDHVTIHYQIKNKSIDQLYTLIKAKESIAANGQKTIAPITLADVIDGHDWLFAAIKAASFQILEQYLDQFAKSHGYDNIATMVGWAMSTKSNTFAKEGKLAIETRDHAWTALIDYWKQVENKTLDFPAHPKILLELIGINQ